MSESGTGRRPALLGDEEELFRGFNRALVRIVQHQTNTPREVVDDACAFAWQQFLRHQPDRDRNWRAWLVKTAAREAWRLDGMERSHASLSIDELDSGAPAEWDVPDRDRAAIRMRLRDALEAFSRLPEPRREIKALQVTGFSYEEIAEMRGLTYTRVNHILAEANATLRAQQARSAAAQISGPPRAQRLHELERDPPRWLRAVIGPVPSAVTDARAVLPIGRTLTERVVVGSAAIRAPVVVERQRGAAPWSHALAFARASAKRWQGCVWAGLLSREMKAKFRVPTLSYWWKATPPVALSRAAGGPCAVEEPGHARNLHAREPGGPTVAYLVDGRDRP